MESIRNLIVDDHALFRCSVSAMLGSEPEFEIAGEAATGRRSDLCREGIIAASSSSTVSTRMPLGYNRPETSRSALPRARSCPERPAALEKRI